MTKTKLLKAIRKKCLDCSCNQSKEVRLCPITDCSLYTYRLAMLKNLKTGVGSSTKKERK